MVQKKVTKEELRALHIGQTRIFTLIDRRKLSSARVTAQHVKNEEGMEFTCKLDYEACAISITRTK